MQIWGDFWREGGWRRVRDRVGIPSSQILLWSECVSSFLTAHHHICLITENTKTRSQTPKCIFNYALTRTQAIVTVLIDAAHKWSN